MKKETLLIFIILVSIPSVFALDSFCGNSTFTNCILDLECQPGGCSGQICEREGEGTITTCEFRECYVAENYNLSCQCIDNKCQWGYENRTPFSPPTEAPSIISILKGVFSFLTSINPIILLIFGTILVLVAKLARFVGIILIIFALILILLALAQ